MTTLLAVPDSEVEVLGALLNGQADRVLEVLPDAAAFTSGAHRAVYRVVLALVENQADPRDFTLLIAKLSEDAEWPADSDTLEAITDTFGSNLDHHLTLVRDRWDRRRLVQEAQHLTASAEDLEIAPEDTTAELVNRVVSHGQGVAPKVEFKTQVWDAMDSIEKEAKLGGLPPGTPSEISKLDALTGGFQRGQFWIVAARPSIGKTSFALHVLRKGVAHAGSRAVIFSLEMRHEQLLRRLVATEANVNLVGLRQAGELDRMAPKLHRVASEITHDWRLVVDTRTRHVGGVRLAIQRLQAESDDPLELVVVDYLTLLRLGGPALDSRTREVGEVARQLVEITKDLNVPLVCLSQLSRANVKDTKKPRRPDLPDLRDSGEIEQHADGVVFLHRVDNGEWDDERRTELIVGKNRDGPTGVLNAEFDRATGRWANWEPWRSKVPS